MESWKKEGSGTAWRRAIIGLGVLYFVLGLGWAYLEITRGTPLPNALILSFFIAGPGLVVLCGGYLLPRTEITPKFYVRIMGWCGGGIGIMVSLLTIYHLQPAGSIDNPGRAILIISAFVLVPSFFGGLNDAQAKSNAFILERTVDLLHRTEHAANVGGWEINPDTEEVYWTQHLFEIIDVPHDEEPPVDEAHDFILEDDQPIVENAFDEALDAGEPFDVEVRFQTSTGEMRWLRIQGIPETEGDEVVSLRGASQDITELKQRERALEQANDRLRESNERLEQFAYAASHDLQEPLRMVSSYLQLIEDRYAGDLDEDGEEFLEFAVDGADRMRDMINGLLEYSRIETQGEPLEPVDLNEVVTDVCDDLDVRIAESDADVEAEELPHVMGDERQLRQVFQNLLSNALAYSGDEPPQVHISAERNSPMWEVSVRDEGIGIEPAEQDRIFEVFQRLQSRDDHEGSGIGLALCQRIVERHGGDIWVESEPGEGSVFSFTLPAEDAHDE